MKITKYINIITIITILLVIISVAPTKSLAIEYSVTSQNNIAMPVLKKYKYSNSCESYLKKANLNYNGEKARYKNDRLAKNAAMLSVILGVKFAVGPKEIIRKKRTSLELWTINEKTSNKPSAIAISAYRKCKNKEALKLISSLR